MKVRQIIKILFLEDNEDIINWVTKIAEIYKIKVEIGHKTEDYLNFTKMFRFSCVLCDLALDYKDEGLDIVKLHKKRKLKSKIVAFTSRKIEPDIIKSLGFDSYIDKNSNTLNDFIKNLPSI